MKYLMNQIHLSDLWSLCNAMFLSIPFFLSILLTLIVAKILFLYAINTQRKKAQNPVSLLFFSIPIVAYIVGEIAWVVSLLDDGVITKTILRVAWHVQPIQFYAQALFLQSVIVQKYNVQRSERLILKFLALFILLPFVALIISRNGHGLLTNIFFESFFFVGTVKRAFIKLFGFTFLIINMFIVWKKVAGSTMMPYFLRLQLRSFFVLLLISLIPEMILAAANIVPSLHVLDNNMLLTLVSSILFTTSLFFFARRIYHLRFLNLTERVTGPTFRLTDDELLELKHALCETKNVSELSNIHASFFDQLAHIAPERIIFRLCKSQQRNATDHVGRVIAQCIQDKPELVAQFFVEDSLLVYDELAFTHFYEQSKEIEELLVFLEQIDAAVFVPLKTKDRFFGAIVITKDIKKKDELFCLSIQTKMQLYGTFVTYALARFEHMSYYSLLEEYNAQSHELYKTNQKNARFHETLASILKSESHRKNGIMLYKNSLFSCMNNVAEELLQLNPNLHQGHPLVKALKEVVRRVSVYGVPHTIIEKNSSGQTICIQAFSYKKEELFILVSPADITHVMPIEQALLQPADIDYAIFLHATEAGAVVNQMFPEGGNMMHQAKLQFLKVLLSKKVMLLDVHPDDRDMCLEGAKKICHRTIVRTIDPARADPDGVCSALFGKQLFTDNDIVTEQGLLYTLDQSGIIHIADADRLDIKTQKLLVRFLKTGSFYVYKTEQRYTSNAIIIMSSSADLQALIKQGLFLQELYEYLHDAIVSLPDLFSLPFAELDSLARSLQKQLITAPEYHHLFGFSSSEQQQLDCNRPASYTELRQRINRWIKQHMNQSAFVNETTVYTPKSQIQDGMLLEAARRGKQTLKDRKMMRELWDRLQNQSKIAQLLEVDRSSVHRRLKEYGIVKVSSVGE